MRYARVNAALGGERAVRSSAVEARDAARAVVMRQRTASASPPARRATLLRRYVVARGRPQVTRPRNRRAAVRAPPRHARAARCRVALQRMFINVAARTLRSSRLGAFLIRNCINNNNTCRTCTQLCALIELLGRTTTAGQITTRTTIHKAVLCQQSTGAKGLTTGWAMVHHNGPGWGPCWSRSKENKSTQQQGNNGYKCTRWESRQEQTITSIH